MKIEKKYLLTSHIQQLDLTHARVLIRADLNVPIENNKIVCDYKLQSLIPTIDMIQKKGAKIILISHLGRPKHKEKELSIHIIAQWFTDKEYPNIFADTIAQGIKESFESKSALIMLENLRFFPEETNKSETFAKELAKLGDYFVNDAFGAIHNDDTSITLLPKLFPKDKRFIGPLIEKELQALNHLTDNPPPPFVLILGGGKVKSKLPLIESLMERKTNIILLCPAIVFTFLKYIGKAVGKSLVDDSMLPLIPQILQKAKKLGVKLIFPVDYQVAKDHFDGPVSYVESDFIKPGYIGLSIGPKTENIFKNEIINAKTIFFNGAFGNVKKAETLKGVKAVLDAMAKSNAFTVIGGGDSVYLAFRFGIAHSINYLSTGGGATLAYLSRKQLPGLRAFGIYPS